MATQGNKEAPSVFLKTSTEEIRNAAGRLARRILEERGKPGCIVYLERGGMVIARFLCDELGITDVIGIQARLYSGMGKRNKRVKVDEFPKKLYSIRGPILLVDDIVDSGITMREVSKRLAAAVDNEVITCVGDLKSGSAFLPDYHDRLVSKSTWVVYEYEEKELQKELRKKGRTKLLKLLNRGWKRARSRDWTCN